MYVFVLSRRLWRKSRGLRKPFIPNAIGMHLPWRNDLYLIRNIWLSCLYRSAALSCCDDMQPAENCVMSGHSPRQTSTQAWNWSRLSHWIENVWRFNTIAMLWNLWQIKYFPWLAAFICLLSGSRVGDSGGEIVWWDPEVLGLWTISRENQNCCDETWVFIVVVQVVAGWPD